MALLKTIEDINKFLPNKKEWMKNTSNSYYNIEGKEPKKLYAFMYAPKTKEPKKAGRIDFVVYKGVGMAYLILVDYLGAINSLSPSIGKDLKNVILSKENEWGFETDGTGVFIRTNSPKCDYLIYFGEGIDDMPDLKAKETVVTETVYV